MHALLRYPKRERRAVAQECARRSNAVQAISRIEHGSDAETVRQRALHDARGMVVREGTTYTATGETHWQTQRSVLGRVDQYDLVANGQLVGTAGPRRTPKRFRPNL